MTVKQFSKKYGVPFGTVYKASYKVHSVFIESYVRDYKENELYAAVEQLVQDRVKKHGDLYRRSVNQLDNMHTVSGKGGKHEVP